MAADATILIADDDAGHARLLMKNLQRSGLQNPIDRFENGQQVLDFLFCRGNRTRINNTAYMLLLEIRMLQIDGVEVLRQIKGDAELKKMPVIMLTATDKPAEVEHCHSLGYNHYLVKPVDYERFSAVIQQFGQFANLVQLPEIRLVAGGCPKRTTANPKSEACHWARVQYHGQTKAK